MAGGLYRLLATRIGGVYQHATAKKIFRTLLDVSATVEIGEDEVVVTVDKRAHNPSYYRAVAFLIWVPSRDNHLIKLTARWYDPSRGTFAHVEGSPLANTGKRKFTPSGNNGDGDGDWILVLET